MARTNINISKIVFLLMIVPLCATHAYKRIFNNNNVHVAVDYYISGNRSPYTPINEWNVSQVTNMTDLFDQKFPYSFNDNISSWDVSSVTDMTGMFKNAKNFNQDLSYWNLSKVTSMNAMFEFASEFDQPFFQWWDVSNVKDMEKMFFHALKFNQDISTWDVSNVTNMSWMFASAWEFNQNLSNWNISNVQDMHEMFSYAWSYNYNLSNWDTSKVTDMNRMFYFAKQFNQDVSNWKVSNVKDMHGMFGRNYEFNHDLSLWDTNSITSLSYMFYYAKNFTGDVSSWNTSNVIEMNSLFKKANMFNEMLPWNTGKVIFMDGMFAEALSFNQHIGSWDTSNVVSFQSMFQKAIKFNQDIRDWNTGSAKNMLNMFSGAKRFNSMISNWDVSKVTNFNYMFNQCSAFSRKLCWDISIKAEVKNVFTNTNGATFYCFDTPTITPRPCLDNPDKNFKIWEKPNLDCNWLRNQKNLNDICDKESAAKEACPDTCDGFCYVATRAPVPAPSGRCNDITWKFTMWGKPNMNCEWLGRRPNLLEICGNERVARESCPVTCKICDSGDTLPPAPGPKPGVCADISETFTMWGKPNMNCRWIGNKSNTEEICAEQEIARQSCPITCKSCNDINPTPYECKDISRTFTMLNNSNIDCKWLRNRSDRLKICMNENIAKKLCPVTCDACDDIDILTPSGTVAPVPVPSPGLCSDISETFTMWGKPNMNCKWVKNRLNVKQICREQEVARKSCPVTCDSCEEFRTLNPSPFNPKESCTDSTTTFTMWNKTNMNCSWIGNQSNTEEICTKQDVAKISCPVTCNSCNDSSTSSPTPSPSVVLTNNKSCSDSTGIFTMWNKPNMNCRWLAKQDHRETICAKEQVAREACPSACDTCENTLINIPNPLSLSPTSVQLSPNQACTDSIGTFTMWNKPNMNCSWLKNQSNTAEICADQEVARESCPSTCGVCNVNVNMVPNIGHFNKSDNLCSDLSWTTFTLWNRANLTCNWLNGQVGMDKICSDNDVVKDACPSTCAGLCKGGFYTQTLSDTNSCTDSYNTEFNLSNKKNVNCNWLARLDYTRRTAVCNSENSVRYNCPDTCEGYCGLAPITLISSGRSNEGRNLRSSKKVANDVDPQKNDYYLCTDNPGTKLYIDIFVDCNHLSTAIPSEREDICAEHKSVRRMCPDTCAGYCVPLK